MASIYAQAIATTIWLGPDSDDSHLAVQTIKDYSLRWMERTLRRGNPLAEDKNANSSPLLTWGEYVDSGIMERLEAIKNLMHRLWWTRVWVVQEAALAHIVVLYCGKSSPITWEQLLHTSQFLLESDTKLDFSRGDDQKLEKIAAYALLNTRFALIDIFASIGSILEKFSTDRQLSLGEALVLTRKLQATDPRDKVYAVLGLVGSVYTARIPVDYGLSVSDVFSQTCKTYIEATKDLSILYDCDFSSITGLPSWALDWSVAGQPFSFYDDLYSADGRGSPSSVCSKVAL
jgi:hypothetical protein